MVWFWYVVAVTAGFYLAHEMFRRSPLAVWLCFAVAPLALTPHWRDTYRLDIFVWAKFCSVLFGVLWLSVLRFTSLERRRRLFLIVALMLALNVLEAVVMDLRGGHSANYLNALAGALLMLTAAGRSDSVSLDRAGRRHDLLWTGATRPWIIGYTIWNWVFVYLNYPSQAANHSGVLAAALVAGLVRKELWLQARGYTLALSLMLLFTFPELFGEITSSAAWRDARVELWSAAFSLLFMSCYAIWRARQFVHNAAGAALKLLAARPMRALRLAGLRRDAAYGRLALRFSRRHDRAESLDGHSGKAV